MHLDSHVSTTLSLVMWIFLASYSCFTINGFLKLFRVFLIVANSLSIAFPGSSENFVTMPGEAEEFLRLHS